MLPSSYLGAATDLQWDHSLLSVSHSPLCKTGIMIIFIGLLGKLKELEF